MWIKCFSQEYWSKYHEALYRNKINKISCAWLLNNFKNCPLDTPLNVVKIHTRTYILWLICRVLFSNRDQNTVRHKYLYSVRELENVVNYYWGLGILANLYRSLDDASNKNHNSLKGFVTLL